MTIEQCAQVYAVKYVLDYNSFKKNEKLRRELTEIHIRFNGNKEFDTLFEKYVADLRTKEEMPRWARLIMAERYSINI